MSPKNGMIIQMKNTFNKGHLFMVQSENQSSSKRRGNTAMSNLPPMRTIQVPGHWPWNRNEYKEFKPNKPIQEDAILGTHLIES